MQTLGISGSSERTDGRLKSLFWPSIHSGADVDYLGAQGYWVCTAVAVLSFVFLIANRQPATGVAILLFYYLGGVGVRERSRYAATVVLIMYAADLVLGGIGVVRVLITVLLISNLRATWIAAGWNPASDEAVLPPRLNETFSDKFADQLPAWLWPRTRILYYIFSSGLLLLTAFGIAMLLAQHGHF